MHDAIGRSNTIALSGEFDPDGLINQSVVRLITYMYIHFFVVGSR